jgi:hypothetical protein
MARIGINGLRARDQGRAAMLPACLQIAGNCAGERIPESLRNQLKINELLRFKCDKGSPRRQWLLQGFNGCTHRRGCARRAAWPWG